jgi:hypothetical protein
LSPPCKKLPDSFEKVFKNDMFPLLSDREDEYYKASELRLLTFQYTCPANFLHVAFVAATRSGSLAEATSPA